MIKGGISKRCPLFYTPQRGDAPCGRGESSAAGDARMRPPFSFQRKENGRRPSKRKAFRLAVSGLNDLCASGMRLPARGVAALALLYDLPLLLSSAVAQRVQRFKIKTANVRGQGVRPLAFLWGFQRGYSLWTENTPFAPAARRRHIPAPLGGAKTHPLWACKGEKSHV